MIECRALTKVYEIGEVKTVAIKDVSFVIGRGEFVAIMGASGSGKSTLMHILGCLDTPSSGEYELDEQSVGTLSDDTLAEIRRSKIGFVFQSFHLLPRATALRNVMLPLVYARVGRRERREFAVAALRAVAFPEDRFSHRSNQLSGGQMQRVAIARALVNNPLLLLADEPTGNLDSDSGNQVLATFQRIHQERGCTVILITHEGYVAEHAERIISLRDGRILSDEKNRQRRSANHA